MPFAEGLGSQVTSHQSPVTASRGRRHLLGLLAHFFDRANHVERLFRQVVVLAFDDFLERAHVVGNLHVFAFQTRELLRDEHGLREEFLDLSRARHGLLVFIREFFDAQNRDDVLQVLVTLEDTLDLLGGVVMFVADDGRIEDARV